MNQPISWADDLVEQIATRVCERIGSHLDISSRILGDQLSYSEAEAAQLIGVPKHVLKGARERGEITPVKIGKGYRYSRELLCQFVNGATA